MNFWEENIGSDAEKSLDSINDLFDERADEIIEAVLDDDARTVATTISGYVAKKLINRSFCDLCKQNLTSAEVDLENNSSLKLLSRGGLFARSRRLAYFVCGCFAILDFFRKENIRPFEGVHLALPSQIFSVQVKSRSMLDHGSVAASSE